ncbi:MAG: hypothetical protein IT371_05770 [Deltaproteobacteria bacterium]|nr:hypothetical protein [Deltaproteobacteria bacterium]
MKRFAMQTLFAACCLGLFAGTASAAEKTIYRANWFTRAVTTFQRWTIERAAKQDFQFRFSSLAQKSSGAVPGGRPKVKATLIEIQRETDSPGGGFRYKPSTSIFFTVKATFGGKTYERPYAFWTDGYKTEEGFDTRIVAGKATHMEGALPWTRAIPWEEVK